MSRHLLRDSVDTPTMSAHSRNLKDAARVDLYKMRFHPLKKISNPMQMVLDDLKLTIKVDGPYIMFDAPLRVQTFIENEKKDESQLLLVFEVFGKKKWGFRLTVDENKVYTIVSSIVLIRS